MLNFLRRLFQKRDKTEEVRVDDLVHTPAANFELIAMQHIQRGVESVWSKTSDIDELSEHIQHLMEVRNQRVQERFDLVAAINKQRKVLGLEDIDEEGACTSELADDETYALEP